MMDQQVKKSYHFLIKWMFISICAGTIGSLVVRSFFLLSGFISGQLLTFSVPVPFWALAGALVAGGIIYKIQPHSAGEGIPSYLRGIRIHKGDLLISVTFFKYWAALATLSTFGNGGIVGPLGRVSSGLMAFLEKQLTRFHIGFNRYDQRTAAICGLAATVGAVFHASIGGGIFAVEIIQRARMGYKDLFPAILSSTTAVFICKLLGWSSFYKLSAVDAFMDTGAIGWLVLLAVLAGLLGGLYTTLYKFIARRIKRKEGNVLLKVLGGSLVASFLAWFINPELLGTSKNMIAAIFTGNLSVLLGNLQGFAPVSLLLIVMLTVKAVCNCITVGSGMSAGFTGPSAMIGMLFGAAMAHLIGVPAGSATFHAFVAAGFSGMLASSMNIPLAAAVMTTEVFGLHYSFSAALAAIIGFQMTRHQTIYDYALAGSGKNEDED